MPLDGCFWQEEPLWDPGTGQALGDQSQGLELTGSQRRARLSGWLGRCAQRELLKFDRAALEVRGGALKGLLGTFDVSDVVGDPDHTDRLARLVHHHRAPVA